MMRRACAGILTAAVLAGCGGTPPTAADSRSDTPAIEAIEPVDETAPSEDEMAPDEESDEEAVGDETSGEDGDETADEMAPDEESDDATAETPKADAPTASEPDLAPITVPTATPVVATEAKQSLLKTVGGAVMGVVQKLAGKLKSKKEKPTDPINTTI